MPKRPRHLYQFNAPDSRLLVAADYYIIALVVLLEMTMPCTMHYFYTRQLFAKVALFGGGAEHARLIKSSTHEASLG